MSNLTAAEMAARLNISTRTLNRLLAKTRGATYLKVGRSKMFRPEDVKRLEDALVRSTVSMPAVKSRTVSRVSRQQMSAQDYVESRMLERSEGRMRLRSEKKLAGSKTAKPKPSV